MRNTEASYNVRILSCIIAIELLVLAVFNFWPKPDTEKVFQDLVFSENSTAIEEVLITRQESSPPPPPSPRVPVPVPNDEIIEEEIVFQEVDFSEFSDSLSLPEDGRLGDTDRVSANPQRAPSLVKIVEANKTEAAKEADLRVRVWVNFLVGKEGRVEEASIASVEVYDEDEKKFKPVQTIGYGLTGEILTAALQWRFRPAQDQGEPVKAYAKHAFDFGI